MPSETVNPTDWPLPQPFTGQHPQSASDPVKPNNQGLISYADEQLI